MNREELKRHVSRLAAHAGTELKSKPPHWGDGILCDGLTYVSRELGISGPTWDAVAWFAPKLATGPRTDQWIWTWAAEALPALDIHLLTGQKSYLDYARAAVNALDKVAAHTPDGALVPHPPALEVWVDMSYFSAPAMARLGRILADPLLIERAIDQLMLHRRYLQDAATGLLWHVAYVDRREHSPHFWARGNSWFSIAATEVLGEVKIAGASGDIADKTAPLCRALARQLGAVIELQDRNGLWHTVIDRPDSYFEASSAAGFALALGRALRMNLEGLNRERATQAYERALDAVCARINSDDELTSVSQQTPPGDFAHYQSIEVGTAPFATGVCLMALAEAFGAAS
jgi:rhamnogalacturonyl hydrolase YesR